MDFKSSSPFWHQFWYPYVSAYIEAEAEKRTRIAKVPEEYQSEMIALLLLPREKPFCPVRLPREDQHPRDGG